MTQYYDFTKETWHNIIKPVADTPCVYCNDNHHEWWVEHLNIHVPTLFDMADYAKLKRERFEVVK